MNWRNLLVVFASSIAAFVVYDVAVAPALAGLMTKQIPKADK